MCIVYNRAQSLFNDVIFYTSIYRFDLSRIRYLPHPLAILVHARTHAHIDTDRSTATSKADIATMIIIEFIQETTTAEPCTKCCPFWKDI